MTPRGQVELSRYRRWLGSVLIALVVLALVGLAIYYQCNKPQPVPVLWKADVAKRTSLFFTSEMLFAQITPLPNGGVAVANSDFFLILNGKGEQLLAITASGARSSPTTFSQRCIADDAGNVCYAFGDRLLCYDEQGRKRWEWNLPGATREDGKPDAIRMYQVTPAGTVFIASDTHLIYEITATGTTLHQTSSDAILSSKVALYKLDDGGYLFASRPKNSVSDGGIVRIANDGSEVWYKGFTGRMVFSLNDCDGFWLVSMYKGGVYAIDLDGNDVWTYQVPPGVVKSNATSHKVYPCGDKAIFVATNNCLAALDRDGHILWTLGCDYIPDLAVESADRQYLLQVQESRMVGNLYAMYFNQFPSQSGNVPDPPAAYSIVRVDHGRVTKRWRAPAKSMRLVGPGARGEYYLVSDGSLYCVKLD